MARSRAKEEAALGTLEVVLEVLQELWHPVVVEEGSFADSDVLLFCGRERREVRSRG